MSGKSNRKALLALDSGPGDPLQPTARLPSGAVRAMGLSLGRLQDEAAAAHILREQISAGATVAELDPGTVDNSPLTDRLAADNPTELEDLVRSVRESGQQVPALVRPHPEAPGRYQIAYGHRRLHAARILKLPLKAVVRPLTDAELAIAQGQENLGRRDLSFIERAQFAAQLERRGFDRATLNAALSVHAAEMTRYLAVARAIPPEVIRAIGPAPKAGRTRWMELARITRNKGALAAMRAAAEAPDFTGLSSDARFSLLFNATRRATSAMPGEEVWRDPNGEPVVRIERSPATTRLTINERLAPGFGDFASGQIADLYQAYLGQRGTPTDV